MRARTVPPVVAGLVVLGAAAALTLPQVGSPSTATRLVLETTATLVAGLAAVLVHGRHRRSGATGDLLLTLALAVLSGTTLLLVVVPYLVADADPQAALRWLALLGRTLGTVLLAVAAVVPRRWRLRLRHPARDLAVLLGLLAGLVAAVLLLGARLPEVVQVVQADPAGAGARLTGHPVLAASQVLNLVALGTAAVAFSRRAAREQDGVLQWFGAAAALGCGANLAYLVLPSLYTEVVGVGDALRLGFYLLLLGGAVREIHGYWHDRARLARDAERRALARELHDGVVQELGYLRMELARRGLVDLVAASDRALADARSSLASMTEDRPLAVAVREAAEEVGSRYATRVEVSAADAEGLDLPQQVHLVRIVREAVGNAARHGEPSLVRVELAPRRLRVADDGHGFAPEQVRGSGYGLESMRSRAGELGGSLVVESGCGRGTLVEVRW